MNNETLSLFQTFSEHPIVDLFNKESIADSRNDAEHKQFKLNFSDIKQKILNKEISTIYELSDEIDKRIDDISNEYSQLSPYMPSIISELKKIKGKLFYKKANKKLWCDEVLSLRGSIDKKLSNFPNTFHVEGFNPNIPIISQTPSHNDCKTIMTSAPAVMKEHGISGVLKILRENQPSLNTHKKKLSISLNELTPRSFKALQEYFEANFKPKSKNPANE